MPTLKIPRAATGLSPGVRTSARRAIHAFSYAPDSDNDDHNSIDPSDSDLATPPSSDYDSAEEETFSARGRKRKRDTTRNPTTATSNGTAPSKRSPRKAPKIEKQGIKQEDVKPKAKRQPAKRIRAEDSGAVDPPPNWQEMWDVTADIRKRIEAPVDSMGCESLAEEHRSPRDRRLQTLVALMLSSQTKDPVTAAAMKNLQTELKGGFNLEALLEVEPDELNRMIGSVGFHNNKTKYIKATALIIKEKFDGEIPDTIEGLISLPGVGPKMAYLTMSSAWGRDEGIGVDVHVHRISNLWKWNKTNTPEQTRAALESWLPRDRWHAINHLLVGLGQTVCLPVGRKCGECDLNARKLCPSAVAGTPKKKKAVKKEAEVELEGEPAIKAEEVIVEEDETAAMAVEVKSEEVGNVVLQGIPDIEDFASG